MLRLILSSPLLAKMCMNRASFFDGFSTLEIENSLVIFTVLLLSFPSFIMQCKCFKKKRKKEEKLSNSRHLADEYKHDEVGEK